MIPDRAFSEYKNGHTASRGVPVLIIPFIP